MNPELRAKLLPGARLTLDAVNGLLAPLDRLLALEQPEGRLGSPQCLFILGAPRSGTTLTYQLITQQFEVAYFTAAMNYLYGMPNLLARLAKRRNPRPAPIFESRYGKIPGAHAPAESGNFWFRWFPRDGTEGNHLAIDRFSESKMTQLRSALASLVQIHQKPMVFKCVYLSMVIPILAKALPQAKFVYVKRDMRWNCHSLVLARQRLGLENQWWSVRPPGYRALLGEPLWKQAAEQILRTRMIIERDLREFARGRFLEIEYEALCDDPRSVLERIRQWLAPQGYTAYREVRLPRRFARTTQWMLTEDEQLIRAYLEHSWPTKTK